MSREIKFRAWHNEANEYCEGETSHMFGWIESGQDVTLEQYTGLTDKNGVEIYEGDVVDSSVHDCKFQVLWVESFAAFFLCVAEGYAECPAADYDECLTVIGNIHQNPELLEQ